MTKTIRKKKKPVKSIIGLAFVYIALIAFALWILMPFSLVLLTSFKGIIEANSLDFHWLPEKFTLQGYEKVLEYDMGTAYEGVPLIISGFINTLMIVIPPTLLGLFSSAISAYAFAKLNFKFRNKMFAFLLATMMIPGAVLMMPSYVFYDSIGWTNTVLPLVIPGLFGGATTIFFMRQFFRGIPSDLLDAAKLDGLGFMGQYVRIMIPLSKPAFISQFIFGFIGGYNDYMGPLIYLQNPDRYTVQIALNALNTGNADLAMLASAGVLALVPMLLLYVIFQKQIINGISISSGLKG